MGKPDSGGRLSGKRAGHLRGGGGCGGTVFAAARLKSSIIAVFQRIQEDGKQTAWLPSSQSSESTVQRAVEGCAEVTVSLSMAPNSKALSVSPYSLLLFTLELSFLFSCRNRFFFFQFFFGSAHNFHWGQQFQEHKYLRCVKSV